MKEDMVERLGSHLGGRDEDAEVVDGLILPTKVIKGEGPECVLVLSV
jgi:hypothetical protein